MQCLKISANQRYLNPHLHENAMDNAYYLKKPGIPEEDEVVLCTVQKILFHSVFVSLDEYKDVEAMIHISEIAPGRIRNIRDYVKEGKKLVCKVLKIDLVKKHVDLSLRRVPAVQKSQKMEEYKEEQKAAKIMEYVAHQCKVNLDEVYQSTGKLIIAEYGRLFPFFQEASSEGLSLLKKVKIPDQFAKPLLDVVQERIKPKEVMIDGVFILTSFASDGVLKIKDALKQGLEKTKNCKVKLTYLGAPRYRLEVLAPDYKIAEQNLKAVTETVLSSMKAMKGTAEFTRK